jgi:hypothetical protein
MTAGYLDVDCLSCTARRPVQTMRLPMSTAGRAPRAPAAGRRDFRPALAGCTVARKIALFAFWLWGPRAVIMCSNSLT